MRVARVIPEAPLTKAAEIRFAWGEFPHPIVRTFPGGSKFLSRRDLERRGIETGFELQPTSDRDKIRPTERRTTGRSCARRCRELGRAPNRLARKPSNKSSPCAYYLRPTISLAKCTGATFQRSGVEFRERQLEIACRVPASPTGFRDLERLSGRSASAARRIPRNRTAIANRN